MSEISHDSTSRHRTYFRLLIDRHWYTFSPLLGSQSKLQQEPLHLRETRLQCSSLYDGSRSHDGHSLHDGHWLHNGSRLHNGYRLRDGSRLHNGHRLCGRSRLHDRSMMATVCMMAAVCTAVFVGGCAAMFAVGSAACCLRLDLAFIERL